MKTTLGHSWRSLVSKIHPPLPISPRDSHRLLALLNSSFKQQLERYHPTCIERDAGLHLRSLLSNPLFQAKPSDKLRLSVSGRRKGEQALDVLQNLVKRPADIFKEQMHAGRANLDMAKLCLRAEQRNCLASPIELGDALSSSGIGSLILEWLWASGLESSRAFVADWDFVSSLVPFLVAEKQQNRIFQWLQQSDSIAQVATLRGLNAHAIKDSSNLLLQLISAEVKYGEGLESAINTFSNIVNEGQHHGSRYQRLHNAAAWYLTVALTDAHVAAKIDKSIVGEFKKSVMVISRPRTLILAYHSVYLAKNPRPDVALSYLQGLTPDYRFPRSKRPHVVLLGLKAAEIFLGKGRDYEAMWLMEYLQTNFRDEVGADGSSEDRYRLQGSSVVGEDPAREEEKTLRSLDTLAIP